MSRELATKLFELVPEKEQVIRQLIPLAINDRKGRIQLSEIIEHIAIRENQLWAYKALNLIEESDD